MKEVLISVLMRGVHMASCRLSARHVLSFVSVFGLYKHGYTWLHYCLCMALLRHALLVHGRLPSRSSVPCLCPSLFALGLGYLNVEWSHNLSVTRSLAGNIALTCCNSNALE